MKKFVVERNLPGAANMTPEELRTLSKTSNEAVARIGKAYSWVQSYITEDKIYCVHIAESEKDVREHARYGRFPINTISEVKIIIDPTTANMCQ
jgi:hypothetical protein